jgi:hypothetical protein
LRTASPVCLLALTAVAFAWAACDKQSACRPNTVFVQLDLGRFTTASEADIGVSVDGATTMTTALPITPGTRTGGVEVVFPHGYPSGKSVVILVTLKADGKEIATHTVNIGGLTSGCQAIDVMFDSRDAATGAGGAGGANGGTGGLGGDAGTSGVVAGTSGGGRGGGAGGSSGAGGRGGSGGACNPGAVEDCFNGWDDDCDGQADCSDPDCALPAKCVPFDPTSGRIGVMMPFSSSCPDGYTDQFAIFSGLSAGGCTGCSCRPPGVKCSTTVSSFKTAADCSNTLTQGTPEITFSSAELCTVPSWLGSNQGTIYGVQVSAFVPTPTGSCAPVGTPTPGPLTWGTMMRFCAAPAVGVGCGPQQACVPVIGVGTCAMFEGQQRCPLGSPTTWYTGATDSRSCGACICGPPATGCSGMVLNVGADYSCSTVTQTLSSGQRKCYSGNGVSSPGIYFSGTPTPPACPAAASMSGAASPTGPKTLCCL